MFKCYGWGAVRLMRCQGVKLVKAKRRALRGGKAGVQLGAQGGGLCRPPEEGSEFWGHSHAAGPLASGRDQGEGCGIKVFSNTDLGTGLQVLVTFSGLETSPVSRYSPCTPRSHVPIEKAKGSFQGSQSLDIHTVPGPLQTQPPAEG